MVFIDVSDGLIITGYAAGEVVLSTKDVCHTLMVCASWDTINTVEELNK